MSSASALSRHYETSLIGSTTGGAFTLPHPSKSPSSSTSSTLSHSYIAGILGIATGGAVLMAPSSSQKSAAPSSGRSTDASSGDKDDVLGFVKKIISASTGGAIGAGICYPWEGLKKRVQSGQTVILKPAEFFKRSSALHPLELYRGSSSFMASVTIATTTSMLFNRALKLHGLTALVGDDITALLSGMLGAVVGSTPVENVILTQQLNKVGPFQAWRIMLNQGITRPWVGVRELAMREAGFAYVMLRGASAVEEAVFNQTKNDKLAFLASLAVGACGATATQPFDVVATYRQHSHGTIPLMAAIKQIVKKQGPLGLLKGLEHRLFLFTGCALIIPKAEKIIAEQLA